MNGYKHLTIRERDKIESLLKERLKPSKIAENIGCSLSTIYRELKQGEYLHTVGYLDVVRYSADKSQSIHDLNATAKGAPLKIGNDWDFVDYVENKIINNKYSPDAIIGEIKKKGLRFKGMVCTRTLYNYIDSGNIFANVTRESLVMKGKRKRTHDKIRVVRAKYPLAKSIEDRPKEIDDREAFGHWEMDTVIGKAKGDNPVLLVLTERKTRFELLRKISGKTQDEVIKALDAIERELGALFSETFKTITIDNGSEFLNDSGLERSINGVKRTNVYFCHSHSSWERGSNENANKLVRRFCPKGEDIQQYSHEYVSSAENWINDYPRRILKYYSSSELFRHEMGFLIS